MCRMHIVNWAVIQLILTILKVCLIKLDIQIDTISSSTEKIISLTRVLRPLPCYWQGWRRSTTRRIAIFSNQARRRVPVPNGCRPSCSAARRSLPPHWLSHQSCPSPFPQCNERGLNVVRVDRIRSSSNRRGSLSANSGFPGMWVREMSKNETFLSINKDCLGHLLLH